MRKIEAEHQDDDDYDLGGAMLSKVYKTKAGAVRFAERIKGDAEEDTLLQIQPCVWNALQGRWEVADDDA